MPYRPPARFLPNRELPKRLGNTFEVQDGVDANWGRLGRSATERSWIHALYIGEVLLVDEEVGRLLDELRAMDLYEEALIILTSDHGEEFWDHGGFEHGQSLFAELTHVPLIIKTPANLHRGSVRSTVSTASIVPTVLEACGIEYDPTAVGAQSVWGYLDIAKGVRQDTFALSGALMRGEDLESVRSDGWTLIETLGRERNELYNLLSDPNELVDLSTSESNIVTDLRELLRTETESARKLRSRLGMREIESPIELDEVTKELLKSMGYLR